MDDFQRRDGLIGPTILLSSGRYFNFLEPSPLTIREVAHGLSHLCRFTGQCRSFYSVAQHSVLVSKLVPPELALWGLLHDAVESVVGDVASPLKRLVPEYKAIEHRCEVPILEGFGLTGPMPAEVKRADLVALRTEQRDLMPTMGGGWLSLQGIEPAPVKVRPWPAWWARLRFLWRYEQLVCGNLVEEALAAAPYHWQ
jgi:uncharacterized protein